jgi:hypothetical protein
VQLPIEIIGNLTVIAIGFSSGPIGYLKDVSIVPIVFPFKKHRISCRISYSNC